MNSFRKKHKFLDSPLGKAFLQLERKGMFISFEDFRDYDILRDDCISDKRLEDINFNYHKLKAHEYKGPYTLQFWLHNHIELLSKSSCHLDHLADDEIIADPQNSYFQKKMKLLSLDNYCFSEWWAKSARDETMVVQPKFDGCALGLRYQSGR